jgi:hypothetical protein
MSDRPRATAADVIILVLTPALIMALINSLVFFLVEVFYAGAYTGRLLWILFFFVCGAVLIARVAMMGDIAWRANVYGAVLGGLVWVGLARFVEYPKDSTAAALHPLINLGLVVLALWCARRLTKDCTDLGDDVELTGEGLLQAGGLEALDPRPQEAAPPPEPEPEAAGPEPKTWIERYYRARDRKRKRRAPGVSVVWFSLAALPLFGLGQALIPPEATGRRLYTFFLLTIYVASGLGLLLTTCFLGLRRYLRQRKLEMPKKMAVTWLGVGVALIAALLLCGAFLPRPSAEVSVLDVARAGSEKQKASDYAVKGGDETGEGKGRQAGKEKDDKDGGKEGKDGKNGGKDGGKGKDGKDGGKDKDGGGKGREKDKGGGKDGEKDKDGGGGKDDKRGAAKGEKDKDGAKGEKKGGASEKQEGSQDGDQSSSSPRTALADMLKRVAPVLKWIVFGLIALLVLLAVLRGGLRWLAGFSQWARDLLAALRKFWEGLFGAGARAASDGAEAGEGARTVPLRPFASFGNPFLDGRAGRMTADELVRYTFAALQAWAAERGWGRQPGETPLEFARRLGDEAPALADDVRRAAMLYARCVYGAGAVPDAVAQGLRGLWQRLEAAGERSLSA